MVKEVNMKEKNIVCLGGGIGTVNLIKGLKDKGNITVIVSMADEGGSAGRLRRLYNMLPPGDLVSCMTALSNSNNPLVSKLLTYRFPGDRYAKDEFLAGHKLGSLIMVALQQITGSFEKAIEAFLELFSISGTFLPATLDPVSISAKTIEGKIIKGEENIDMGKYAGKRILEQVYLEPNDAIANPLAIEAIKKADIIVVGPGDLYTTILPVLLIPKIADTMKNSNAPRYFIVNVANKPFETKGYTVSDFLDAIKKHLDNLPFDKIIINSNYEITIPKKYHYSYVMPDDRLKNCSASIVQKDLIDENFPLYNSSAKLAKALSQEL